MVKPSSGEVTYADLSAGRRWLLLIIASMGSSIIYAPAYLKGVFYDPLQEALGITNTELGAVFGAYAITALICYLPSGLLADKIRMRTLSSVGFLTTGALTLVYAMLPSLAVLYMVFVGMGVTTILIWWGVRFKLVRLVSKEDEYPKRIGLSYGIYGVAGLLVGLISTWIVSIYADDLKIGVSMYLYFLAALIILLGILSLLFIPKFKGEIAGESKGFSLKEYALAFRDPVVWIAAISLFFVYFYYTGVTYTTPYMTGVLGVSLAASIIVSNIRTYGITLLSGPIFGQIANKFRPSVVIASGSLIFVAALLVMMFLPSGGSVMVIAMVLVVVLGFVANGSFSVVSAQLTEGKVPLHYFGAATGLLSVIGFLPDTFSSIWFGAIMDANLDAEGTATAAAYQEIFWILNISAVLAALSSLVLFLYIKKRRASKGEVAAESATN